MLGVQLNGVFLNSLQFILQGLVLELGYVVKWLSWAYTCMKSYLVSSDLSFSGRLVLVMRSVQSRQGGLVGLADLLELLHVTASSGQIDFGHFQSRP